jgi:hypothetical protein
MERASRHVECAGVTQDLSTCKLIDQPDHFCGLVVCSLRCFLVKRTHNNEHGQEVPDRGFEEGRNSMR